VSTIIVDVSGSMRETLTWQLVRKHLHDLEASNPSAAWVAADTGVRATLSGPNAVDQLLALDMSGSTSLAQIASSYQGSTTIVITDEDGEKQLRDEELQLKRIGLARPNGIEWQSTAN
jgi:predicted metal-dependent peptidase